MPSSTSATDAPATHRYYNEENIAALIRSLDRAEDHHIFAVDVLETYPYLAESYSKVCPHRCDLATAAQKALEGAYSHDARLEGLRADIALMVSNCVTYNGPTSAYAETAAKFERFAQAQIDRFLTEHNGGRRVSRLRLPSANASPETPPAQDEGSRLSSRKAAAGGAVASKETSAAQRVTAMTLPSTREVAQLVDSLDRREDGGAFSVDVAEAYPDLRESYQKVCPHSMSLRRMHQRAKEGHYTNPSSTAVYGDSVAASFPQLREDIELLVRNCITFNAKVESWVTLARSFQSFAHRRVDDFVLRHAVSLRGTPLGADVYPRQSTLSAGGAEGSVTPALSAVPADTSVSTAANSSITIACSEGGSSSSIHASAGGRKRERHEERGSVGGVRPSTAGPPIEVVAEVTPQVCPTPLQPTLEIPPLLRQRLAADHVRHTRLPLRRVGISVALDELYPPISQRLRSEDTATAAAAATATFPEASGHPSPSGGTEDVPASPAAVVIDAACSAGHVLEQLRASIVKYFAAQRSRSDFADVFSFSVREEQFYLSLLAIVAEQFRSSVASLLLYEQEAAELQEWVALRALQMSGSGATAASLSTTATSEGGDHHVANDLHYLYLVRFLVQWPQLASLCCATAAAAQPTSSAATTSLVGRRGGATAPNSLRVSRDQLKAVAQVTLVTQELLQFIEAFEVRQRSRR